MVDFRQSPMLAGIRGFGREPSSADQDALLDQLIVGLDAYYAHLPLKRSAYAIDPVEELRLYRASGSGTSRVGFLRSLLKTINGLRDRHTTLRLPPPWSGLVAYLPFVVESFDRGGRTQYVVTKHLYGFGDIPLGSIIQHWNGVPIHRQIGRLGAESQGANQAAAMRLGLANLTIRPLAYVLMPDEDWATVTYVTPSGELATTSTPWRLFEQPAASASPRSASSGDATTSGAATSMGLDHTQLIVNTFKQESDTTSETKPDLPPMRPPELQTDALGIKFGTVPTSHGEVGYVRIFSFEVPSAAEFLESMEHILRSVPQDRVIIDVRDNPGGLIPAGQQLIRMLTTKDTLTTSPLAFRNTYETRGFGALSGFAPWQLSLDLQYATGQQFSQALPITTYDGVPEYRYPGSVAVIIDALCYSTTDFFAADFRDNGVGVIVGTDPQTGGGGANVWTWDVLQYMSRASGGPVTALPAGFGMNVSVRRSVRTGAEAGLPVEDRGVAADHLYRPSLVDGFGGNIELIDFTASVMDRP